MWCIMGRLKACSYCGRIHSGVCGQRPKRVKESTEITRLRTCRRWEETRKAIYERDHYMCRVCLEQGRITTGKIEAHHIVPLVEDKDLAYDVDNGITLCIKHHKAADRGEIDRDKLRRLAVMVDTPPGVWADQERAPEYHTLLYAHKIFPKRKEETQVSTSPEV